MYFNDSRFDNAKTGTLELPALNINLLSDLVTWAMADACKIEELNERFADWGDWKQSLWAEEVRNGVCQTAFCIAGQAVSQNGFVLNLERYGSVDDGTAVSYRASDCVPGYVTGVDNNGSVIRKPVPGERTRNISSVAQELIGLHDAERTWLFEGKNSIEEIIGFATVIAKSRGLALSLPNHDLEVNTDEALDLITDSFHVYSKTDYNDYGSFVYVTNIASDYQTLVNNNGVYPAEIATCESCGQVLPENLSEEA